MNDLENRRHRMFVGVRGFGTVHSPDFAPNSVASQLFTSLGGFIMRLDEYAATEVTSFGAAEAATSTRAVSRQAVRDAMRAISRTAEAIALDTPGFGDKFQMPPAGSDQSLLNAARSFVINATPLAAQFISHELPADFLAALNSDIADLETAISQYSTSTGAHVSAGTTIDELIAEGLMIVKKLDAIVRNRYRNDSAALAEWTSASHTQHAPKRKAPPPTPPPTPPTPPA
jgi:hypothetical protein